LEDRSTLNINVPFEDPRVAQAQELLALRGMKPWAGFKKKMVNEYTLYLWRTYEPSDWETAELFEPEVGVDLPGETFKGELGRVLLHIDAFNPTTLRKLKKI